MWKQVAPPYLFSQDCGGYAMTKITAKSKLRIVSILFLISMVINIVFISSIVLGNMYIPIRAFSQEQQDDYSNFVAVLEGLRIRHRYSYGNIITDIDSGEYMTMTRILVRRRDVALLARNDYRSSLYNISVENIGRESR
jgi:hypothetical protein